MNKYRLKIALIGILITTFFIQSCKTEEEILLLESTNQIIAKEYGFYHNEALKSYYDYYKKKSGKKSEATDILNQDVLVLINDMTLAIQEKYPKLFAEIDLEVLKSSFSSFEKGRDYDFEVHWQQMTTQKRFETRLEPELISLVNESLDRNYDFETILNKLDQMDVESDNKDVFKSVLIGSNDLWFGEKSRSYKGVCSQRTIIADAGTSLILVASGPLSIIGGAISSLITDASCVE